MAGNSTAGNWLVSGGLLGWIWPGPGVAVEICVAGLSWVGLDGVGVEWGDGGGGACPVACCSKVGDLLHLYNTIHYRARQYKTV